MGRKCTLWCQTGESTTAHTRCEPPAVMDPQCVALAMTWTKDVTFQTRFFQLKYADAGSRQPWTLQMASQWDTSKRTARAFSAASISLAASLTQTLVCQILLAHCKCCWPNIYCLAEYVEQCPLSKPKRQAWVVILMSVIAETLSTGARKADIFIVVNASTIELPDVERYIAETVADRPLVLWNLELDTLRADLGEMHVLTQS